MLRGRVGLVVPTFPLVSSGLLARRLFLQGRSSRCSDVPCKNTPCTAPSPARYARRVAPKRGGSPVPAPPRVGRWPCSPFGLCSPLPALRFGRPRLGLGRLLAPPAGAVAIACRCPRCFYYSAACVFPLGRGGSPPAAAAAVASASRLRPSGSARPSGARPSAARPSASLRGGGYHRVGLR